MGLSRKASAKGLVGSPFSDGHSPSGAGCVKNRKNGVSGSSPHRSI